MSKHGALGDWIMNAEQGTERTSKDGGFTLIEVIVAISILAVGLLAVASMQTAAIRGNFFSYRVTEGTTFAQDRLEWLLALPYDDALLASDVSDMSDPLQGTRPAPGVYSITYDVDVDSPISGVKRITVKVIRTEKGVTSPPIEFTSVKVDV